MRMASRGIDIIMQPLSFREETEPEHDKDTLRISRVMRGVLHECCVTTYAFCTGYMCLRWGLSAGVGAGKREENIGRQNAYRLGIFFFLLYTLLALFHFCAQYSVGLLSISFSSSAEYLIFQI